MQIINLTGEEVLKGLNSEETVNGRRGDYYRKFCNYDDKNILGLYYKELDINLNSIFSLEERINILKDTWNFEYTWEHYKIGHLFALVNRLDKLEHPPITGIALYSNYPVGTLFPKELLSYKKYFDLISGVPKISKEEKEEVLRQIKMLLQDLILLDVYPTGLYAGNILVNPNDISDVRLDGLDGPHVARVESKEYVRKLKKRGGNLVDETWSRFEQFR